MKKNMRLSDGGKTLLYVFALAGSVIGTSFGVLEIIKDDPPAEQTSAPGGINALVTEFSAAVTAEAKAKMEEAAANVGKPDIVRKACEDVGAMMNKLSADSGITTKIVVTPYQSPSQSFEFGYCVMTADNETITFINDGDELTSESHRRYMIEELIENLPADDIMKIHAVLTKAPAP